MSETNATVSGTDTQSEEQRKRNKLRDLFPPKCIEWDSPGIYFANPGAKVICIPRVDQAAICDRLDAVLGADSWRESYENPGEYTRCRLEVRFQPGGDWVSRVGVSNRKDLREAQADAFREAARSLGVGRYLNNGYREIEVVAKDGNKTLKAAPQLPQHLLPHEYQTCTRETANKCRELINQACAESGRRGRAIDPKHAAANLTKHYGLVPDNEGHVFFSRLTNGEVGNVIQLAHSWIAEIARGELSGLSCPVKTPETGKTQNKSASTNQAQTQAAQGKSAQPANAG